MSDDRSLEDELLRRFQALKSTPTGPPLTSSSFRQVNDEQARKAKEEDEELECIADGRIPTVSSRGEPSGENDLARRIASLRGVEYDMASEDDIGEDAEVEAFIASLSGTKLPDLDPENVSPSSHRREESSDHRGLEREAKDILRLTSRHTEPRRSEGSDKDVEAEEGYDELETEEEIIKRMIDESSLERRGSSSSSGSSSKETREAAPARGTGHEDESPAGHGVSQSANRAASPELAFPSLPSHIPEDTTDDNEVADSEAYARMALLLGLSGPSTAPGPPRLPSPPREAKRKPGQGWNLPGYKDDRDDDPDSWCCICNKDADVICLGCDDDPYCESCWMEGHVGERHRTKRFASTGGKRAVGA